MIAVVEKCSILFLLLKLHLTQLHRTSSIIEASMTQIIVSLRSRAKRTIVSLAAIILKDLDAVSVGVDWADALIEEREINAQSRTQISSVLFATKLDIVVIGDQAVSTYLINMHTAYEQKNGHQWNLHLDAVIR